MLISIFYYSYSWLRTTVFLQHSHSHAVQKRYLLLLRLRLFYYVALDERFAVMHDVLFPLWWYTIYIYHFRRQNNYSEIVYLCWTKSFPRAIVHQLKQWRRWIGKCIILTLMSVSILSTFYFSWRQRHYMGLCECLHIEMPKQRVNLINEITLVQRDVNAIPMKFRPSSSIRAFILSLRQRDTIYDIGDANKTNRVKLQSTIVIEMLSPN